MELQKRQLAWEYTLALLGAALFSAALNIFIMPYGLLSANLTGVAQILTKFIMDSGRLPIPPQFNLTGLILGLFNVPLILLSLRHMSRHFLIKTVLASSAITVFISLIPVPAAPVLDSVITSSIIGGILTGCGSGIILRGGGSGGGVDVLGVMLTKKFPRLSVGKISIIVGALVLLYCLLQNDVNLVVYSAIYTVVYSLALDKVHYQTIKTGAMIFSKTQVGNEYITKKLGRGANCWEGASAYTGQKLYISYAVISKDEAVRLRRELRALDPAAFIVFQDGLDVQGNYESHL